MYKHTYSLDPFHLVLSYVLRSIFTKFINMLKNTQTWDKLDSLKNIPIDCQYSRYFFAVYIHVR
jgi:hypothetical protein